MNSPAFIRLAVAFFFENLIVLATLGYFLMGALGLGAHALVFLRLRSVAPEDARALWRVMRGKEVPGDERLRRFFAERKYRIYDDAACVCGGEFIHRFGPLCFTLFVTIVVGMLARGFYVKYILG